MKKSIVLYVLLGLFGLFLSVAQLDAKETEPAKGSKTLSDNSLKIGVFDIQKILRESRTIGRYREQLLKSVETKRKPLQDRENLIKALDEKLKKDGKIMSETDRKVFEEKLAGEIKETRRMKEDFDAEVSKMDKELMRKVFSEINVIIKKIAEQENYTIIFDVYRAGIAHFKNTIDITNKILEQLK